MRRGRRSMREDDALGGVGMEGGVEGGGGEGLVFLVAFVIVLASI